MNRSTHGPTRLSSLAAVLSGGISVVTSGYFSWTALALGTAGLLVLVIALVRASYRLTSVGTVGLVLAGVVASLDGVPAWPVLVSVVSAVVAWDVGRNAISVGNHLGRAATTARLESVHLGAGLGIGVSTGAIGYGLFLLGGDDLPSVTLVLLVVASVLFVHALRSPNLETTRIG